MKTYPSSAVVKIVRTEYHIVDFDCPTSRHPMEYAGELISEGTVQIGPATLIDDEVDSFNIDSATYDEDAVERHLEGLSG